MSARAVHTGPSVSAVLASVRPILMSGQIAKMIVIPMAGMKIGAQRTQTAEV